jgi:hypothetical protein
MLKVLIALRTKTVKMLNRVSELKSSRQQSRAIPKYAGAVDNAFLWITYGIFQLGGRTITLYRRHDMVGQILLEHATTQSTAAIGNRSRRMIECAKDLNLPFYALPFNSEQPTFARWDLE